MQSNLIWFLLLKLVKKCNVRGDDKMNFAIAGRERADKTVTLPPLDLARSDILETLNLLFEEIQKTYPSIFQTFESLLLEKSKSLINDIKLLELNSDFSKEISEHKYLQNWHRSS